MIIRHNVTILSKQAQYTARVKDSVIYITVPRIVFHGGTAHLVARQTEIRQLADVLAIYEHIDDRKPLEAWNRIGQILDDVYLKGIK